MTHKTIDAHLSQSFSIDRFCVAADLLGARHEFMFSGKAITVELPREQENSSLPRELWSVIPTLRGTEETPLAFRVNRITMLIAIEHPISIPEDALKVADFRRELFTNAETKKLDNRSDSLALVALDAFRHWMAVLRWISGVGYIGEPSVVQAQAPSGATLQESATRHRFWIQPAHLRGKGLAIIPMQIWHSAQTALSQNKKPPIWFTFLFEGEQRINNRDLIGAVLSLAIALETLIRNLVTNHLPEERVEPLIFKIVDRANLRAILSRIRNLTFWNQDWEHAMDFNQFNKLMDWRDGVMHRAHIKDLNEKDLRQTYRKLKTFAYFVSEYLGYGKP